MTRRFESFPTGDPCADLAASDLDGEVPWLMAWPEWSLAVPQEIARFVNSREALRIGLRPRNAEDLRLDPTALAAAIYADLRDRELGYSSIILGNRASQVVQTPSEVLNNATPSCVDITTLFASACLAAEVIPLIALVTKSDGARHTLLWIVPNADPRSRRPTDLGKIGGTGHVGKVGRSEVDDLLSVADAQGWTAVETTGVCRTAMWNDKESTVAASLDFDEAVAVADAVLRDATRVELVDVHRLQHDGMAPWIPPEMSEARRARRNRLAGLGAVATIVVVATVGALMWRGDEDPIERMGAGFNVAVGGLVTGDSDEERDALTVTSGIANSLTGRYGDDSRFTVWGPDRTGIVDSTGADERAAEIGADVLVYGSLSEVAEIDNAYAVDMVVHSAQHSRRAPWPLAIDERIEFRIDAATIAAGTSDRTPSIAAFTLTLDGLAALLADDLDIALERLERADEQEGPAGPALIPALHAWTLLVGAGVEGDASLVADARDLAAEALRRDPASEFAQVVSVSADYLTIIPARANEIVLDCGIPDAPESPASPDLDEIVALRETIEEMLPKMSEVGAIQLTSLLGRLTIAEALAESEVSSTLDLTTSENLFSGIIDRAGDDRALTIWVADAHRFLGLIALNNQGSLMSDTVDHFVAAARIATPLRQASDFGSAGRALRCAADPALGDAVCFFEIAVETAPVDERDLYRTAIAEVGADCPANWELP